MLLREWLVKFWSKTNKLFITFHWIDDIRISAHKPRRGHGCVCLWYCFGVISPVQTDWAQHRVSFLHQADKNQHTGGMLVRHNLTTLTHSKMDTHALQGVAVHTHTCLRTTWGSNIWQRAPSKKKHKQLVKCTIQFFVTHLNANKSLIMTDVPPP